MRADGDEQVRALLVGQEQRQVLAQPRRPDRRVRHAELVEPLCPGRAAVRVRLDEQLGPAAKRVLGDRVHVADDHVRAVPGLAKRVGPAVDADEDGVEPTDVRADDAEVTLVAGATRHDQGVAIPEPRPERREIDAFREDPPLLAEVEERVLEERLQRLRHAAPLLGERELELVHLDRPPGRDPLPVAEERRAADRDEVAFRQLLEQRRPRHLDQPHTASHEEQRSGIREAAGL